MPDSTVAVADGRYRYDVDTLLAAVREQWPDAGFSPATGRMMGLSLGQIQIPTPLAPGGMLLVEIDPTGRALDVGSPADALVAEFVAGLTRMPGFPDDGSVVIGDWGLDLIPLRANMSSGDLLATRA